MAKRGHIKIPLIGAKIHDSTDMMNVSYKPWRCETICIQRLLTSNTLCWCESLIDTRLNIWCTAQTAPRVLFSSGIAVLEPAKQWAYVWLHLLTGCKWWVKTGVRHQRCASYQMHHAQYLTKVYPEFQWPGREFVSDFKSAKTATFRCSQSSPSLGNSQYWQWKIWTLLLLMSVSRNMPQCWQLYL